MHARNIQTFAWLLATATTMTVFAGPPIQINEIRIDQPGMDLDEYFELVGPPGTPLTLLWYVVIGDGPGGSGVVEAAIPLSGQGINPLGFFVAAEPTFSLRPADMMTTLNFENSDNVTHIVTHILVEDFFGQVGQDLDLDDDCELDVTPWLSIVDSIALIEEENPPEGTE